LILYISQVNHRTTWRFKWPMGGDGNGERE